MAEEVKTIGNWAKELGLSDKKLKEAVKSAGVEPDAKKGACSLYSRKTVEKLKDSIK